MLLKANKMQQQYFVVLELPDGSDFINNTTHCPVDYWIKAAQAIEQGKAKMISRRQDTGVCEDLRKYLQHIKTFTTFILVTLPLCIDQSNNTIFEQASQYIANPVTKIVVDGAENFQLVALEA